MADSYAVLPYLFARINSPRIIQDMFHSSTVSPHFPAVHRTVKTAQHAPNFMARLECRVTKRVGQVTNFGRFSRYSSRRGNWDSVPGQFMWDLGQTQRKWDVSLSQ